MKRTVLSKDQFCILGDPYDKTGKQQLGKKQLLKGPFSFFLKPGNINENIFIVCYIFWILFFEIFNTFLYFDFKVFLGDFWIGPSSFYNWISHGALYFGICLTIRDTSNNIKKLKLKNTFHSKIYNFIFRRKLDWRYSKLLLVARRWSSYTRCYWWVCW